jgi:hypothetical protein
MSFIFIIAPLALFVSWVIATVKKSTPLALGLGVILMGLLLMLVVVSSIHNQADNLT